MQETNSKGSPRFPNWLVSKCLNELYHEEFFGDLQEIYEARLSNMGKLRAQFMYWFDTLHLLIGFMKLPSLKTQNNNTMMIKSMLTMAWRSSLRHKQFTLLNMLGLTLGISVCLLAGLYYHNENSYDSFFENEERIYRVNQPMIWNDWDEKYAATGPNVAVALREEAKEFEAITRLLQYGTQTINKSVEESKFNLVTQDNFHAAEANFFEVFSYKFLAGDRVTCLQQPMTMVLTEKTANRYFGTTEALGKSLSVKKWDGTWDEYLVTGVLADLPLKSHLKFDMLISLSSNDEQLKRDEWKWIWTGFATYGLVKEGTDIAALTEKIQEIPPRWAAATTERIFNQTYEEFTGGKTWSLYLQPLQEIYSAGSPNNHAFGPTGNPQFVNIFGVIGLLVIVLSSINFMNLSTARSLNRAKEVGVRKVLGSQRSMLIKQFILESVLFVTLSTIPAILLVQVSLPWFNSLSEKQIELIPYLTNPLVILACAGFVLLIGLLAGSYPAFYLSSFRPISILKGGSHAGFKGKGIRNGLVVFQFAISIALIICTFFVQKQLSFASNMDVGYMKDNVLQIHNIHQLDFDTKVLEEKFRSNSAFTHVGKSFGVPPYIHSGDRYKAEGPDSKVVDLGNLRTEPNYIELLGLEFTAGRNFSDEIISDKYSVILNEEAVKVLGWGSSRQDGGESPIGKKVVIASAGEEEMNVIGIVKNFNMTSIKDEIRPLIIIHEQNDWVWDHQRGASYISMRLNPEAITKSKDIQFIIDNVKTTMADVDPSVPFEYSFMDQEFDRTFRAEQRMSIVLNIFTMMALVIACLGLFGLAAFAAEQRIKELGIRKVLGARVTQLVYSFSTEFMRLILLSILIAIPISYYIVSAWLSNFPFRTSIEVWVFTVASAGAMGVALITVGFQSLKAAYQNPVDILKYE